MQVLRRFAVLIWPALIWLGTACDQPNEPTATTETPSMAVVGGVFTESVDLIVDDDGMADAATGDCNAIRPTHITIQSAINAASNGQVIGVCPGLYTEPPLGAPLLINKAVTLLGAQSGVDARTRGAVPIADEAVIADPQGTSVSVSGVVIDGFTVQNSTIGAFTGYGLWLNPTISGTQILNNIIQNNIIGIGLANSGPAQAIIRHNWIRDNNAPGSASGTGIYTDQFAGGLTVRNVLIDENRFSGHAGTTGGAINLSNTAFTTGGVFGLEVSGNGFATNSRAFVLFNTHDSRFHDNTVTGSTFAGSADVRLFDGNTGLLFTLNDLNNGAGMHAIRFSTFLGFPSSDVAFHQNNIEVYGLTGLTVDPGSHTGTVDAECNWWNSPSGPFNVPNNPSGTGEEVVGDADFAPWLVARAPGGACVGGLPSGKVTGGGTINVFGGIGSFGFNASQDGGVASGHLNYLNHASGTHLNCTVDRITVLTATMAKFNGTCSSRNYVGTYMAEVEDNGQSGKSDKFKITYTGGSDGSLSTTIRSGNIQIHQ